MKKRLIILAVTAAALAVFYFIPDNGYRVTDIVTGLRAEGFGVSWPWWRVLIEPFAGMSEYLQTFGSFVPQYVSWMLWLAGIILVLGIAGKKSPAGFMRSVGCAWLVLLSLTAALLLTDFPSPKLTAPPGWIKVNFHSHTYASKDAICSAEENIRFHRNCGFDASFITEHNDYHESYINAYMGMQLNTENISLLLLGEGSALFKYKPADLLKKTIPEAVRNARAQDFSVICPHWWKWGKPSWEELHKAGVQGFEIFNANYRDFGRDERQKLIDFCKSRKLLMVGDTDWKGFGRYNDVWTAFKLNAVPENASGLFKAKDSKVLVNARREYHGGFRKIFEPFFGIYYYFNSLEPGQLLSWLAWICALLAFSLYKRWKEVLSAAFFFFILWQLVKYGLLMLKLNCRSDILETLLLLLAVAAAGWTVKLKTMLKKNQ